MPIPNRDAVALSARTLGALFSYAPNSAEIAPLVAAFQDGSWQQQWPFPVAAPLASGFAASAEETLPEAWQRLFIGPWALPAPPWALSGWIKSLCCLAIPRWLCASGCARTVSRWRPMATNRKIIRHRATPGGMVVRNGAGCVVRSAAGLAPAAVVRAFPERLCRPCRPPLLSGAGSAGAGDSGAVAGESADRRGAKTALSLTLRRAGIRRGFILPLPSISPALIAFASKVIPYHNKPMFSEPRRD